MKRKWIKLLATLFVCATLALGFTACEDEGNNSSSSNSTNTEQGSSSGSGASSENNSGDDSSSSAPDSSLGDGSSEQTHTHSYTKTITAPTCTERVFTTYTCSCGDSYVDDYVNALNHDFTDYISDNNATYTSDGTKTATCSRSDCNEKDTITDVGTKLQSGITFKTLSITGTDAYGKVSNTTETFSFINEVKANGTAKFVVSLDIYGVQQVATKTIPLTIGDNTVYITEIVDDEPINVYTVTVRRRPMYDVTFDTNGGTSVQTQVIEEDHLATEPEATTRVGYTFTAWDYDFSKPITKTTTVMASWTANTDTPYKVEYYLQNLENDNYTLTQTVNKTGTTDTTANAEIKTFTHFTHKASATDNGNINGDGSQVLKVYYTRNKYTLSVDNDNGGTITNMGMYKYGTIAQVSTASVYLGYDFGWYHGDTLLSTDLKYTFTVEQDIVAKFTVKTEMSNFDFTATATACQITGVKAQTVANIVVPDFVTSIDGGVFSGCSSLTEITLPFVGASKSATSASSSTLFGYIFGSSSYTGGTATAQYYASYKCTTYYIPTSLKKVTVTGGKLLYGAFYNCDSLTSVVIGDGVTSIGEDAFYFCDSLTSVVIGDSVTRIGEDAFSGCSSLTTVKYMGDIAGWCNISFRGSSAFYNCSSLTSVKIPDSVTSIGEDAFENCRSLTSVEIGDGVTTIDSSAFSGCDSLTSVVIPDSVTSIDDYAFYNCSSLTSVKIGDGVTSIGYAFYGCSSLTIYCEAESQPVGWESDWNYSRPVYWYRENQPATTGNYWHYDENGNIAVW